MGAEAAGKDHHAIGFFDKHEFAGEEKMKIHELRIVADERVGILHGRQTDVDAETFLSSRALMTGLHNARPGACDHHPPRLRQARSDASRQMIVRIAFADPR